MAADYLGNPITASSPEQTAAIDAFVGGFLRYETTAADVVAAADADPGFVLANAYAGILWLLLESPDGPPAARPYLDRAQSGAGGATAREQGVVAFLAAWLEDDIPAAQEIALAHIAAYPRDLAMAKLYQYHAFNQGDFAAMLRAANIVLPHNRDIPQAYSLAAFPLEQLHLLEEAEAVSRQALALLPSEPWAQHALAHVLLTQGRIEEGVAFLEGKRDGWVGLNSFMYTHLWWHLALFYLSQGRFDEALAAYDDHVWAVAKDYSQDQIGAVSLLARLEFAGIDFGDRWRDLGGYLAARARDTTQAFLALQYLYGLAKAGRPETDDLLAAIEARPGAAEPHEREAWASAAVPAARGLVAQARGAFGEAARQLRLAQPRLIEIGGSHAQRDFFEQILLDAVLKAGQLKEAQQALELRRLADPNNVPVNRALAEVYAALGLPDQAAVAAGRAGDAFA